MEENGISLRRDKIDIVKDSLEALKKGYSTKTQLMHKAGLSFKQISGDKEKGEEGYLSLLLRLELIGKNGDSRHFEVTDKGEEFLRRYKEVKSLISYSSN